MRLNKIFEKNSIISAGFLFMAAGFLSSGFNYLYHVFTGRLLGPEKYGILGALFAIIYFFSFLTSTFLRVVSKFSAEYKGKSQEARFISFVQKSFSSSIILGFFFLLLFVLLSRQISMFIHVEQNLVVIVGVISYLGFISSILTGALNGLQKFFAQNLAGVAATFLKLIIGVFLVYIGLGVKGALFGILIGGVSVIFISLAYLRKILFVKRESITIDYKKIMSFALPVFFSGVLLTLMITIDLVLVKHFLYSEAAGFYNAAGMIAKIIWFGSGFFTAVLFPKIIELKAKKKDYSVLLAKTLLYSSILAALGCLVYFMFPELVVYLLYGKAYLEISSYIFIFGMAMGFYSITQTLVTFNLAVEDYGFIFILLFGLIIQTAGILIFHSTYIEVIKVMFLSQAASLFLILLYNRKHILR